MSNCEIKSVSLRTILNSQAGRSLEARVVLKNGSVGVGSAPRAIIPGRRERNLFDEARLGCCDENPTVVELAGYLQGYSCADQREFDALFSEGGPYAALGSDVTLALSLAFCRAASNATGCTMAQLLGGLTELQPALPHPIINIFSGGVHGGDLSHQQLMIIPQLSELVDDLEVAIEVYNKMEAHVKGEGQLLGYSASSGMLATISDPRHLFDLISTTIDQMGLTDQVALGTDVAAEHLETGDGRYRLGGKTLNGDEFETYHRGLLDDYNFCFYEDPFGPDDDQHWRALTRYADEKTMIVGDDLFATNARNIKPGLASGILLKMNQVGTVTGTLDAAVAARDCGMQLVVSHRSKETEDTSMCDLAYAVGADLIKIGGPRRGDRIGKYNQLVRLAEEAEIDRSRAAAAGLPRTGSSMPAGVAA